MRDTEYDKWLYDHFHGGFATLCPKQDWPSDNFLANDSGDNSIECAVQWIVEQHLPELLNYKKPLIIIGV